MESLSRQFGLIVRNHRRAAKIPQETLAAMAGIHRTYMGSIERGETNASLDVAADIAKALGVPLSRLIREAEKMQ